MASREQILTACDTLHAQTGKAPNQSQLREFLGGGSFTTIAPVLAEWKKAKVDNKIQPSTSKVPDDVSEALSAFGRQVWRKAEMLADERLASEREMLKAAQDEVNKKVTDLEQFISTLEKELEIKEQQNKEMSNKKSAIITKLELAQSTAAKLSAEKLMLQSKIESLELVKTEHKKTRETLEKNKALLVESEKSLAVSIAESHSKDQQIELLKSQLEQLKSSLELAEISLKKKNTVAKSEKTYQR